MKIKKIEGREKRRDDLYELVIKALDVPKTAVQVRKENNISSGSIPVIMENLLRIGFVSREVDPTSKLNHPPYIYTRNVTSATKEQVREILAQMPEKERKVPVQELKNIDPITVEESGKHSHIRQICFDSPSLAQKVSDTARLDARRHRARVKVSIGTSFGLSGW